MGKLSKLFMVLSVLSFAVPAFAQGRSREWSQLGSPSPPDSPWRLPPASAPWRRARQPLPPPRVWPAIHAARPGIQLALILGLALIESLALYTLVIIFVKVK